MKVYHPLKKGLHIVKSKPRVKKRNYDTTRKFQDSWVAKLPWAKLCVKSNGNPHTIKCKICSEVKGKNKVLSTKWNSLAKHVGCKKATKDIGTNVKKKGLVLL